MDKKTVAFADVIRRVGRCRYLIYLASSMSADLHGLWGIICTRHMGWNDWELVASVGLPSVLDGRLNLFWESASRSTPSARRRWLRPQVTPNAEGTGPITF